MPCRRRWSQWHWMARRENWRWKAELRSRLTACPTLMLMCRRLTLALTWLPFFSIARLQLLIKMLFISVVIIEFISCCERCSRSISSKLLALYSTSSSCCRPPSDSVNDLCWLRGTVMWKTVHISCCYMTGYSPLCHEDKLYVNCVSDVIHSHNIVFVL